MVGPPDKFGEMLLLQMMEQSRRAMGLYQNPQSPMGMKGYPLGQLSPPYGQIPPQTQYHTQTGDELRNKLMAAASAPLDDQEDQVEVLLNLTVMLSEATKRIANEVRDRIRTGRHVWPTDARRLASYGEALREGGIALHEALEGKKWEEGA